MNILAIEKNSRHLPEGVEHGTHSSFISLSELRVGMPRIDLVGNLLIAAPNEGIHHAKESKVFKGHVSADEAKMAIAKLG